MNENQAPKQGLRVFFAILAILALLNVALAFIPVPRESIGVIGIVVGIFFVAAPIYAIFRGGDYPWTPRIAWTFLAVGVAVQAVFGYFAASGALNGPASSASAAVSQMGLMVWCIGLGGLLGAGLIKEPNLLIPVSVFLIAFDIFLVLTPIGVVTKVMQSAPQVFTSIAYQVPKASATATLGPVGAAAYIGPADFIFMAMFFIAMYRFAMNPKGTLYALIPTLILYLGAVFILGPLPALPPIAICVLAVNFKYFKLKRDEWAATGILAALMVGLIWYGATRPRPPVELSQTGLYQEAPESGGSPGPTNEDRPPSTTPPDEGSK